jgi:uncharacterized protein (UPF0262 family)
MQSHIASIDIDESLLVRSQQNKTERDRVVTDLLKESIFEIDDTRPPYQIKVQIIHHKFAITIDSKPSQTLHIPLSPLKRVIKDYHIICDSYFSAIQQADPRKIEAIDMGRRGLHNEGAEILGDQLKSHAKTDHETLRKLFSLIYLLYSQ